MRERLKNKKIRLILSVSFIITGLILLFLPKISTKIIEKRAEERVVNVEKYSPKTLQENLDTETKFDFDSIREISPSQTFSSRNNVSDDLILGRLFIPSIDLNLTVYNGITKEILHAGLGTMRPNLEMGKGNFPIAGHYSRNKEALFGNLKAVKKNDLIYLSDNQKVYEYKVYQTKVVEPDNLQYIDEELAEEHGTAIISLMNCHYVDGKYTNKRYFVFAELSDSYLTNLENK